MERSNINEKKILTPEELKEKIEALAALDPNVRLTVNRSRKKLENAPAVIRSVHSHFFIVEHNDGAYTARYTVRYDELITKEIVIAQLGELN